MRPLWLIHSHDTAAPIDSSESADEAGLKPWEASSRALPTRNVLRRHAMRDSVHSDPAPSALLHVLPGHVPPREQERSAHVHEP